MLKQKLLDLFANDAEFISVRDAHYESSWKKRGGVGAFMTICRPWDRFHAIAQRGDWDIFRIIQAEIDAGKTEADDGTLQACVRDLRAYMSLVAIESRGMRAATTPGFTFNSGMEPPGNKRHETATHGADVPLAVPSPREEAPIRWQREALNLLREIKEYDMAIQTPVVAQWLQILLEKVIIPA